MPKPRFVSSLKRWLLRQKKSRFAGFTLLELLVSMLIGAIITAALLSLVVDMTGANLRDTARSETQRDMQLAMNYITQDLREAVYVYDGDCLQGAGNITDANAFSTSCPGLAPYIPNSVAVGGTGYTSIPVLAFWRADRLPQVVLDQCQAAARVSQTQIDNLVNAGTPCVSGKSYTLVVYALADDTSTTDIWQGKARIIRYQLPQFNANATGTSNVGAGGWVDPLPNPNSSFQQWPYKVVNGTPAPPSTYQAGYARPADNVGADVLVDFVDDNRTTTAGNTITPNCQTPSVITPNNLSFTSFYACVRGNTRQAQTANPVQSQELGINQEVVVVLAGNAAGRAGIPVGSTGDSVASTRLAPLQTRVLSRGIVNKSPD